MILKNVQKKLYDERKNENIKQIDKIMLVEKVRSELKVKKVIWNTKSKIYYKFFWFLI